MGKSPGKQLGLFCIYSPSVYVYIGGLFLSAGHLEGLVADPGWPASIYTRGNAMPVLKNSRHEKFALALLKGMSQQDAAIEAGYKPSRARFTGSELVTKRNIWDRYIELQQEAKTKAIMPVIERKERLSELSRANIPDFITDDGIKVSKDSPNVGAVSEITSVTRLFRKGGEPVAITKLKLHDPVKSIAELNKMEGEYPPSNVLKLEPGETLGPMLLELLSKLRGYGNTDKK